MQYWCMQYWCMQYWWSTGKAGVVEYLMQFVIKV
jgi:hypothetical protein